MVVLFYCVGIFLCKIFIIVLYIKIGKQCKVITMAREFIGNEIMPTIFSVALLIVGVGLTVLFPPLGIIPLFGGVTTVMVATVFLLVGALYPTSYLWKKWGDRVLNNKNPSAILKFRPVVFVIMAPVIIFISAFISPMVFPFAMLSAMISFVGVTAVGNHDTNGGFTGNLRNASGITFFTIGIILFVTMPLLPAIIGVCAILVGLGSFFLYDAYKDKQMQGARGTLTHAQRTQPQHSDNFQHTSSPTPSIEQQKAKVREIGLLLDDSNPSGLLTPQKLKTIYKDLRQGQSNCITLLSAESPEDADSLINSITKQISDGLKNDPYQDEGAPSILLDILYILDEKTFYTTIIDLESQMLEADSSSQNIAELAKSDYFKDDFLSEIKETLNTLMKDGEITDNDIELLDKMYTTYKSVDPEHQRKYLENISKIGGGNTEVISRHFTQRSEEDQNLRTSLP